MELRWFNFFSTFLVGANADPREEDYIKVHMGKLTRSHWWSYGGGGDREVTVSLLPHNILPPPDSQPSLSSLYFSRLQVNEKDLKPEFYLQAVAKRIFLEHSLATHFLRGGGEGREDNLLKMNIITDQFLFSLSFREPVNHFWHLAIEMKVGSLKSFNLLGDHVRPRDYKQFIISW